MSTDLPHRLEEHVRKGDHDHDGWTTALKSDLRAAAARIRELEQDNMRLRTERNEEHARHMDAHHGMQIAKGEAGTLKAEVARLTAERETLTGDPYSVHKEMEMLKAEVARLTAEYDALYRWVTR